MPFKSASVLAQRLRINADHPGYIVLGNAICRHGFDLASVQSSTAFLNSEIARPFLLNQIETKVLKKGNFIGRIP